MLWEFDISGFNLEISAVDINSLILDILEDLQYMVTYKNVKIEFIKSSPPALVEGDSKKLRASIFSIIDNAIRYSPDGTVKISVENIASGIDIFVKDSGVGIDAEDLPYVFERLYRGKAALELEPNETGVGLYTAKKIIELHHGQINIASIKGQGTTVTISLPNKQNKNE